MAERDVDFNITVTREQFYTIVTLMLHDACHDFDAGKTDKEFKKLFMKKKIAVWLAGTYGPRAALGGGGNPSDYGLKGGTGTPNTRYFKKGIDSDASRQDRQATRVNVRKNKRDEALRAKRQGANVPPAAAAAAAQPDSQLFEYDSPDQYNSPGRDSDAAFSTPDSPSSSTQTPLELRVIEEDYEMGDESATIEQRPPQPATDATPDYEKSFYEYIIEHYNLKDLMEKVEEESDLGADLKRIKGLIDDAENYHKQKMGIPTTPMTPPPLTNLLTIYNYDIFIDSLFKILSKMQVIVDDESSYELITGIFIDFMEGNLFGNITGITGFRGDDKYIATFCTDIIETLIDVLTNNYTNSVTTEMVYWINNYLFAPKKENYLFKIRTIVNLVCGTIDDVRNCPVYLEIFRDYLTILFEIYDEIDRVIKESTINIETIEKFRSIWIDGAFGFTKEQIIPFHEQINTDIEWRILHNYGVADKALSRSSVEVMYKGEWEPMIAAKTYIANFTSILKATTVDREVQEDINKAVEWLEVQIKSKFIAKQRREAVGLDVKTSYNELILAEAIKEKGEDPQNPEILLPAQRKIAVGIRDLESLLVQRPAEEDIILMEMERRKRVGLDPNTDISPEDLTLAERKLAVGLDPNTDISPEDLTLAERKIAVGLDPADKSIKEKDLIIAERKLELGLQPIADKEDLELAERKLAVGLNIGVSEDKLVRKEWQLGIQQNHGMFSSQEGDHDFDIIVDDFDGDAMEGAEDGGAEGGGLSKILQIGGNGVELYENGWNIFMKINQYNTIYSSEDKYNGNLVKKDILDDNNDIRMGDPTMDELPTDEDERRNIETIRRILTDVLPSVSAVTDLVNPANKEDIRNRIVTTIGYIRDNIKSINTIIKILKSFIYTQSYNGIKSSEKVTFIDSSTNSPEAPIQLQLKYKDIGYLFIEHLIEITTFEYGIKRRNEAAQAGVTADSQFAINAEAEKQDLNNKRQQTDGISKTIPPRPNYIYNSMNYGWFLNNVIDSQPNTRRINARGHIEIIGALAEALQGKGVSLNGSILGLTPVTQENWLDLITLYKTQIETLIGNYENYLINAKYLLTFLEDQSQHFSTKFKFAPQDKINRKQILTDLINHYKQILFSGTGSAKSQATGWDNEIFNISTEVERIFDNDKYRKNGDVLDRQLWKQLTNANLIDTTIFLQQMVANGYINNAIPNEARKFFRGLPEKIKKLCLTAAVDPMGSFGDCAYRDPDEIKKSLGSSKNIHVLIKTADQQCGLQICLKVESKNNITMSGTIKLNINNEPVINTNIDEKNFNNKQPLSIANTISYLEKILEGQADTNNPTLNTVPTEGIQTVFVRKFLGDFLQAIEALCNNYIYLGGDKPAAVMYYYLKSLVSSNSNGGFTIMVGSVPRTYIISILGEQPNNGGACPGMGGGGLRRLKDKKRRTNRKRSSNKKRRTNRKRRSNKKRKTNRKTNRKKTNNRRRRTSNRRRRSIRKRK